MKKIVKFIFIAIGVILLAIQFIRPEKNNGGFESVADFESDTNPSKEVYSILKKQCFDCHTNQTTYPWYAEVAPISFWLAEHIEDAKKHFNMSAWESYSVKKKDHKLEELMEEVEGGEMPLNSYTWIHGGISEKEKEMLLQWATLARLQYQEEVKVSVK